MRRPKDRLHRVMVIGATPAGIAAANKLGELGIPLILVDSDADLDVKLHRNEWRLKSGLALNHAHRPGLIRILRNPRIQSILPAEITGVKRSPQGFRVNVKAVRSFIDADKCTLCGRCAENCPVTTENGEKAVKYNGRQSLPGRPMIDKRRQPLCQESCPLGVNAQGYIALAKAGKYAEALALIRKNNVLPAICGRICTHPCETACRRGTVDEPVAIRDIKRFVADYAGTNADTASGTDTPESAQRPEKIAVIGSGPSGLAAAADLAGHGYGVTVFEKEGKIGGLLRYGIGPHRLPRHILDREIDYIRRLGVTFKTGHAIDPAHGIDDLKTDYAAVILATGTWKDRKLGVPGEELDGVTGCLAFLSGFYRNENHPLNEKVAVIGDGNAAFDLARTLARIGADVTILSWFPKDLIPADAEEIEAAESEGITIVDCTQTIAFSGRNGRMDYLSCVTTEPGPPDVNGICWPVKARDAKPFELAFDRAFVAIGQELKFTENLKTDEGFRTGMAGVYAAGDAVTGPKSVVEAMAAGKKAAWTVHADISRSAGIPLADPVSTRRPGDRDFYAIAADLPHHARTVMPEMAPEQRKNGFAEVAVGFSESDAIAESARCLQCGVCSECLQCVDVCSAIGAVNHADAVEEIVENAGVIIIADPEMAPRVRGEDVIRAYSHKGGHADVSTLLVRGFDAAAQALQLLGRMSGRPRGHGVSFLTPDQGLSPNVRIGVFACRCNDSMGWLGEMDAYIEQLTDRTDVVHAEAMTAACIPDGAAHIVRTIRNKGITRVVLASCVCCPLNFVCNSCTDQKSRLKDALFSGTGISRSMVEACNLRGEVLRMVKADPDLAIERFTGLMDRSIARARRLKALPALARNYNFTTAVIGESESAKTSATTLADAGFEVFLFGNFTPPPVHLNIHNFTGARVDTISGTIGEFEISFTSGGFTQPLQVGAVILGEKSRRRIQYIHQKGLPAVTITAKEQQADIPGIPFFYPGATAIPGLFLADPPGIRLSKRKKGAAAAIQAACVMPRGPRQSKGFTVVMDDRICRGCGRCMNVCPYQAVTLNENGNGGWAAAVDEALCKGCGNCISVCPTGAADSPYRNQALLEQTLGELLTG